VLSERAEEILEALWINLEEQGNKPLALGPTRDDPAMEELVKLGLIKKDADHMHLLEKGKSFAAGCVRRHRLSERLLIDIFDIKKQTIDEISCKFEHLLHEGLEDKICMILGHPKTCPHGKPIPPGKCCKEKRDKKMVKLLSPLSDLGVKDKGSIAYLQAKDPNAMQKLISIGAIPGLSVMLLQKFPSYVFQIGQTQFAIDKELASSIYIRLNKV